MKKAEFRKRLLKLIDEAVQDEDEQTFHDFLSHVSEHVEDGLDRSLAITEEPEGEPEEEPEDDDLDLSGEEEADGD